MALEPEDQEETSESSQQEVEMYNNKCYFDDSEDWKGDSHHYIHMHKVKVLIDKFAME